MTGTEGKGLQLLTHVNLTRSALGLEPLAVIPVARWPEFMSVSDAITEALGAVGSGDPMEVNSKRVMSVAYRDDETARRVAAATGLPYDGAAVAAPDALDSLSIADTFGLVFVGPDSDSEHWKLTGWIEPTDQNQSVWNLHKLPGDLHPPGHEPTVSE